VSLKHEICLYDREKDVDFSNGVTGLSVTYIDRFSLAKGGALCFGDNDDTANGAKWS
jgi:hypothetical protein